MKIILITDVPKVGNRHEVRDFKDGYANLLIQRGVAIIANSKNLKELEEINLKNKRKKEDEIKIFESMISSVKNKKIEIKVKANEKGHLFKSINNNDIVKAILDITGIEIDKNLIIMDNIKELGVYKIQIKKGEIKRECEVEIKNL